MIQGQKIEEITPTPLRMTIPAGTIRSHRSMHPQRGTRVYPIGMMKAKGTAAQAVSIQLDILPNDRKGVLLNTPLPNAHQCCGCTRHDAFFCRVLCVCFAPDLGEVRQAWFIGNDRTLDGREPG